MLGVRCCGGEECSSSVIDLSTPDTLHRDFHNWLNGIDPSTHHHHEIPANSPISSQESPKSSSSEDNPPPVPKTPITDGRKNRRKGTNLYGRPYCPGRPLSMAERTRIIELHSSGMKVNAISKSLCISHGCVSKIISRFRATGILLPASSPEQGKSRKRKPDSESPDYNSGYNMAMHDSNGNEYVAQQCYPYPIAMPNDSQILYDYSMSL
ncbi:unnamed protein product [Caenorhabditis bovis]|uniref:Paired domain-containing protein n=1 Tax=Caenorhabditis bovis TaxID=2654633 RepID=A0A8S1FAU2_9PELO|nr:unnamed protein product [Caenorhabditis bovis]